MTITVYRKSKPVKVNAYGAVIPSRQLGALTYDPDRGRVLRYTPDGELIDDVMAAWRSITDFNRWAHNLSEVWSLKPEDAYWIKNDYWIDAGL